MIGKHFINPWIQAHGVPSLQRVLMRGGDAALEAFVGRPALRALKLLDHNSVSQEAMVRLSIELHGEAGLLRNRETRSEITDILRPNEAVELCAALELDSNGDTYGMLRDRTIRRKSSKERSLFRYFGCVVPDEPDVDDTPPLESCAPQYALFDHQRDAAHRAAELLHSDRPTCLLHMPTGAGKTRTAMHIVAEWLRSRDRGVVLWLAYSEELCEQAFVEFTSAWSHLGDREVSVRRFFGKHSGEPVVDDGLVVAGLSKLWHHRSRELAALAFLAPRLDLLVFDEAHQSVAGTYQHMLDTLLGMNDKLPLLGLTATPGRTWNSPEEDRKLSELFNRQKVVLEVEGYASPVDYLVASGHLARPDLRPLEVDGESLSRSDLELISHHLDIPDSVLKKLAVDEMRNAAIVARVEQMIEEGHRRLLVFGIDVAHATLISTLLKHRGIDGGVVTSLTERAARRDLIERYKSRHDAPFVLSNYGVLTTGFDAPRTTGAVIARPTKSLVLYSQMLGRVIRGPKVGGSEQAEVWTVVDAGLPGFGDLGEAFSNWEDVWED